MRVWLPLKMHGAAVFERALDEKLDLASWATDQLRQIDDIEIVALCGDLPELLEAIERDLPTGLVEVIVHVPYSRGDLISRAHRTGEVVSEEHDESGTLLRAKVPGALAAEMAELVDSPDPVIEHAGE